jgi:hypothetical protein
VLSLGILSLIFIDFKVIFTFIDQEAGLYIGISRKTALKN